MYLFCSDLVYGYYLFCNSSSTMCETNNWLQTFQTSQQCKGLRYYSRVEYELAQHLTKPHVSNSQPLSLAMQAGGWTLLEVIIGLSSNIGRSFNSFGYAVGHFLPEIDLSNGNQHYWSACAKDSIYAFPVCIDISSLSTGLSSLQLSRGYSHFGLACAKTLWSTLLRNLKIT